MGKEFISGTALDPRLDEHLLTRLDDIRRIARELNEGHYYLILAPAGSGRTTTLKAIERHLRDRTSVLLLRPTDLSLASGREFFQSICEASDAALLESSGFEAGASRVPLDAADRPFDDWLITRTPLMRRRLIYLFDDIDLIPPNLLARLADIAHGLYNERNARPTLNRVGFVFAGSISLRYLTLKDNPNVSPFNVCSEYLIHDLPLPLAVDHLRRVVAHLELTFDDESLERLVHWAGGDLNLLHRLAGLTLERVGRSSGDGEGVEFRRASAGVRRITPEDIDESVATLVPETGVIRDEALRRILFLVEEDRRTLQLVLDLLETEPRRFEQGHAEEVLLQAFGITYPELSGALALGRSSGAPTSWRFRHRLARRLAEVYLTPRRAVRLHVSYGEFEAAERQARRVLTRVRALFTEGRLDFEDSGLADVLLALTNHIYASASDETAYQYMALLLTEAFGCEDLAYYEYVQPDNALKAPKFLSHLFSANSGQTLDLGSTSHQLAREVRAYKSRLFFSDDRDGDRVRVAFPLKSLGGLVTAVIGATLADRRDGAITVGFKVQTIQKALNPINIALNRVEVTLKNRIIDSAQLVRGGRARGLLPVFVAHKFNAELLGNMRDHLGRASKALDFSYVDEREASGLLLPAIRRAIESCGLALYEVTKPNNNVYFEIGLGLGLNRPGLLFRRKVEDSGRPSMPTLLAPLMRLEYGDYTGLLDHLNRRLEQILNEYSLEQQTATRLHFLGVDAPICSKRTKFVLVLDHDHFRDQRDYRRHIEQGINGRLPIVYGTKPREDVSSCIQFKNNLHSELEELWAAVRLADHVIFRCEHFEGDAQAAQAFIGAGIAYGRGVDDVHMTFLRQDANDALLGKPADLDGWRSLDYSRLGELQAAIEKTSADWRTKDN